MTLVYRNHLLATGLAASTVRLRLIHLEHLRTLHPNPLECTTEDLEAFLAARRFKQAPETRKSIRSSFRSFYSWAHRTGLIDSDPSQALRPIYVPKTVARIAPDDDVAIALLSAPLHERAMILLGRLAALRLSEIATLHTEQRMHRVLHVTGKGSKERRVPLNDDLLSTLLDLEDEVQGGYYFPGRFGGHMHPASVNKIITRRLGWNPHSLRHAAATAAFEGTHDLRAVQEFLGHSNLGTTERYVHTSFEKIRAAADATAFPRNVVRLGASPPRTMDREWAA